MKKHLFIAVLGAMALTFAACTSEDEATGTGRAPGAEAVKTSFTISMGDVKSPTRMGWDAVQHDADVTTSPFQGLSDIYLFPTKDAERFTGTTPFAEDCVNLPSFTTFDIANSNAKVYKDVSLNVGVQGFLFYASIPPASQGNGDLTTPFDRPMVTTSTPETDVGFDLVGLANGTIAANAEATRFVSVLQDVNDALEGTPSVVLQRIQTRMQNGGKVFAGSANSLRLLFEELYTSLRQADATAAIAAFDAALGTPLTENVVTGRWEFGSSWTYTFPCGPDLNLPDGAVGIVFDNVTKTFAYATPATAGVLVTDAANYVKPAKLYYTANSPAMIRDSEYLSTAEAAGQPSWDDVKTGGSYVKAAVKAGTRSVILQDQVQFAVARLDVQARVKPAVVIRDNGSNVAGADDEAPQIVIVPSDGYRLTGVLIGDQKRADWKFEPVASAPSRTIYDGVMTGLATGASATTSHIAVRQQPDYSAPNTTLALETAGGNTPINIALEFENNGNDFYGIDHNIIPAGTKFYLVARLTPGIDSDGTPDQVLKQDYTTTARLTINETSLKNAYNVIPDLRSPKLEFGLSVNLEWQRGLVFTQDFQ